MSEAPAPQMPDAGGHFNLQRTAGAFLLAATIANGVGTPVAAAAGIAASQTRRTNANTLTVPPTTSQMLSANTAWQPDFAAQLRPVYDPTGKAVGFEMDRRKGLLESQGNVDDSQGVPQIDAAEPLLAEAGDLADPAVLGTVNQIAYSQNDPENNTAYLALAGETIEDVIQNAERTSLSPAEMSEIKPGTIVYTASYSETGQLEKTAAKVLGVDYQTVSPGGERVPVLVVAVPKSKGEVGQWRQRGDAFFTEDGTQVGTASTFTDLQPLPGQKKNFAQRTRKAFQRLFGKNLNDYQVLIGITAPEEPLPSAPNGLVTANVVVPSPDTTNPTVGNPDQNPGDGSGSDGTDGSGTDGSAPDTPTPDAPTQAPTPPPLSESQQFENNFDTQFFAGNASLVKGDLMIDGGKGDIYWLSNPAYAVDTASGIFYLAFQSVKGGGDGLSIVAFSTDDNNTVAGISVYGTDGKTQPDLEPTGPLQPAADGSPSFTTIGGITIGQVQYNLVGSSITDTLNVDPQTGNVTINYVTDKNGNPPVATTGGSTPPPPVGSATQ